MQKTLNSTNQSRAARSDIKRNRIVSSRSRDGRFRIAKHGQLVILMRQVRPVWSLSSTKINVAIARKRRTCSNFWCRMVLSRTLLRRLILRHWVLRIRRRIHNNAYHSAVLSNPMTCEFAIISEERSCPMYIGLSGSVPSPCSFVPSHTYCAY